MRIARAGSRAGVCALLAWVAMSMGCRTLSELHRPTLFYEYDRAEHEAAKLGRPMLIFYRSDSKKANGRVHDALGADSAKEKLGRFIRCELYSTQEPDRRYVAQFGVDRAPALIVLGADGTYHARVGQAASDDAAALLDLADSPGDLPAWDERVPRPVAYQWIRSLPEAEALARQQGLPLAVVVVRPLWRDDRRLDCLLGRPEVHRRLSPILHCWVDTTTPSVKDWIHKNGVTRVPAIVLAQPDGATDVLELPTGYEQIVRFLDRKLAPAAAEAPAERGTSQYMSP